MYPKNMCVVRNKGFHVVRLDGTMTSKQRTAAIEAFSDTDPNSPSIFLLSLKAGGVGINLTAACRIFLMDPVSTGCSWLLSPTDLSMLVLFTQPPSSRRRMRICFAVFFVFFPSTKTETTVLGNGRTDFHATFTKR